MEIGDKIRKIRTDNNMSQEQFAEQFNVTRQAVSNWENGRNYPDMNTIAMISDSFDMSFDELIKGDEDLIHSIDKTRAKAGIWKKLFLFILGVLVAFALDYVVPKAVKALYYDPCEIVAAAGYGDGSVETQRLSSDIQVLCMLMMPGHRYDDVFCHDFGMGKYNFTARQSAYIAAEKQPSFSGRIDRNELQIFESDRFNMPSANIFEWTGGYHNINKSIEESISEEKEEFFRTNPPDPEGVTTIFAKGAAGTTEVSKESIKELNTEQYYEAYISFNKAISYKDAMKWIEKYEDNCFYAWCAVATGEDRQDGPIGFYPSHSGSVNGFDKEKYPYLFGYTDAAEYFDNHGFDIIEEENAKQHIISMLNYLSDQNQFRRMLDDAGLDSNISLDDKDEIKRITDFIENKGIKVYGVAVTAKKNALATIHEEPNVFSIATEVY